MQVACPYCQQPAELVTGATIYPRRHDLAEKWFWLCRPCCAHVGTHRGSKDHAPLGRLADAELRAAKQRAHATFDPMWKGGGMNRKQAYGWLAEQLGIDGRDCHIGMFDVAMCRRVVEVCLARKREAA